MKASYIYKAYGIAALFALTGCFNAKTKHQTHQDTATSTTRTTHLPAQQHTPAPQGKKIKVISTQDQLITILSSKKPTVIKFYMNNCSWCIKMNETFKRLSTEPQFANVEFYEANGPELQAGMHVAQFSDNKYKVGGYPYFAFIKDGKQVGQQLGGCAPEVLKEKVTTFLI